MAVPYTPDMVLATFSYEDLATFAADLGAPPIALADLSDDPSRAHWMASFVSTTLNELTDLGMTAAEWIVLRSKDPRPGSDPIAGATSGLV